MQENSPFYGFGRQKKKPERHQSGIIALSRGGLLRIVLTLCGNDGFSLLVHEMVVNFLLFLSPTDRLQLSFDFADPALEILSSAGRKRFEVSASL